MSTEITATIILISLFLILIAIRVPIVYSIGFATMITELYLGINLAQMANTILSNLNTYTLLAVPFFITMGEVMSAGGITDKLIRLSKELVGWIRGGLAMVNIVASVFFGGISGSSSADCASIGPILIPMMEEDGYDRDFSTCVTMASSVQGILIPPSQNMVIFSLAAGGVSIGKLFMAGYIPGIFLAVVLMIYSFYVSKKKNYPVNGKFNVRRSASAFLDSLWGLGSVLVVVVGVVAGLFTTTESAAVAVMWSMLVGVFVYKQIKIRDIGRIFGNVVNMLGRILILMGTAGSMSWLLTYLKIPQKLSAAIFNITDNKIIILMCLNLFLLVLGMIIDQASIILMVTPIILPIIKSLGMDPVQLGVIMVLNTGIGILTPPVGSTLFIGSAVSGVSMERLAKAMIPFYILMFFVLVLLTYFPGFTMTIPNMIY